ncbi:TetR/AcrR family transcriptional regulator [Streptomyces sp. NPDC093252]|uniref:TetR/AcrR family transcriptional regulator n=1 Tax=Streptomyces sp. NPDC093252 TaxID=3154980 RepID=UPI003442B7C1
MSGDLPAAPQRASHGAPRGRGRARNRAERRAMMLDAAEEVIVEQGLAQTRTADVAQAAGVSNGTLLYQFGTLDALLAEALARAEQRFCDRAVAAAGAATGEDPRRRLERLVEWLFATDPETRRLWRLWLETWSVARWNPLIATARQTQDARWRGILADIVADLGLSEERATAFTAGFAALVDGLAVQVALDDSAVTPETARELALAYAVADLGN